MLQPRHRTGILAQRVQERLAEPGEERPGQSPGREPGDAGRFFAGAKSAPRHATAEDPRRVRTKAGSDVDPRLGLDANLETRLLAELTAKGVLVRLPGPSDSTGKLPALELAAQSQQHTLLRAHHGLEHDEALALDDARRDQPLSH